MLCFVVLLIVAEEQFSPVIGTVASQKAYALALTSINQSVQAELGKQGDDVEYSQIMHLERDDDGRIVMMSPDTMLINRLVADIMLSVDESLADLTDQSISIPLGVVTGSSLLASLGPDINVSFIISATPEAKVMDEFISAGINQTRHRIYVEITAQVAVVVPFDQKLIDVTATILLAEGIIVGYTPDTYLSINSD